MHQRGRGGTDQSILLVHKPTVSALPLLSPPVVVRVIISLPPPRTTQYISTHPLGSDLLSLIFLPAWDAPREIRFIHHRQGGSPPFRSIHRGGSSHTRSALDRNINYFHDSVQRARFIVCHHFRRSSSPSTSLPPTRPPHSSPTHALTAGSRGGTRPSPHLFSSAPA